MCSKGYLTGWRRVSGGDKLSICQLSQTSSVPSTSTAAAAVVAVAVSG